MPRKRYSSPDLRSDESDYLLSLLLREQADDKGLRLAKKFAASLGYSATVASIESMLYGSNRLKEPTEEHCP